MVLVQSNSLEQKYEQVNEPDKCNLEIQSEHQNNYAEDQVEVQRHGVENWPNHFQLPQKVAQFVLHVIESLSYQLVLSWGGLFEFGWPLVAHHFGIQNLRLVDLRRDVGFCEGEVFFYFKIVTFLDR